MSPERSAHLLSCVRNGAPFGLAFNGDLFRNSGYRRDALALVLAAARRRPPINRSPSCAISPALHAGNFANREFGFLKTGNLRNDGKADRYHEWFEREERAHE